MRRRRHPKEEQVAFCTRPARGWAGPSLGDPLFPRPTPRPRTAPRPRPSPEGVVRQPERPLPGTCTLGRGVGAWGRGRGRARSPGPALVTSLQVLPIFGSPCHRRSAPSPALPLQPRAASGGGGAGPAYGTGRPLQASPFLLREGMNATLRPFRSASLEELHKLSYLEHSSLLPTYPDPARYHFLREDFQK